MSLSNKKHIFFDLDDTLWDFQRNSALVLEELFHEFEMRCQRYFKNLCKSHLDQRKKKCGAGMSLKGG